MRILKLLQRKLVWLVLSTIVLSAPRGTLGCSCVPENLCPAEDVDLRLVDSEEACPLGSVCCDVLVNGVPVEDNVALDLFCDGECLSDKEQCVSEDYDEYGTDLIDVRLISDGGCPDGYTCCKSRPAEAAVCSGSCVPKTLCTMFELGKRNDGCTGGNVCCQMNRESWMGLINEINGMELGATKSPPGCEWVSGADGARSIPPWLVSIWARVEIIPGLASDQFVCAGALTDAKHVLTLASCVETFTENELFVNAGDYDLSSRSSLRMENIYSIQEKMIHEDYNSTHSPLHDVAILRLARDTRNGNCQAPLDPVKDHSHYNAKKCFIVGWNRELLVSKKTGRPQRYESRVASFNEDLFCPPGTICLEGGPAACDGSSLKGSPVFCVADTPTMESTVLKGLLASNCTGVSAIDVAAWVSHKTNPGFIQVPKPSDPSRQYLPSL